MSIFSKNTVLLFLVSVFFVGQVTVSMPKNGILSVAEKSWYQRHKKALIGSGLFAIAFACHAYFTSFPERLENVKVEYTHRGISVLGGCFDYWGYHFDCAKIPNDISSIAAYWERRYYTLYEGTKAPGSDVIQVLRRTRQKPWCARLAADLKRVGTWLRGPKDNLI